MKSGAEGKLKVDTVKSLNLEHSWSDHGYRVEKFGNLGSMPVRRYFPFVALEDSVTGSFTGVLLYAPSSWQIELLVKEGDFITISGGLADRDFGWYADCGYWWDYRGDWRVNKKRFPNGLKELTDYIRDKGMIPGIWYELENASQEAPVLQGRASC